MTDAQKVIKYLAIALALFLIFTIFSGIAGGLGLLSHLFDGSSAVGELQSYDVSANVESLELTVNGGRVEIRQGDSFRLESNLAGLKVTEKNGTLEIKHKKLPANLDYENVVLTLTLPRAFSFTDVRITVGAAKMDIEALSAQRLRFELGAGDVNIQRLDAATAATIQGGAGRLDIADGTLTNLELQMGVGELNLTAALFEESEVECGVGQTNLVLLGSEADYSLDIEAGLGTVTVNGKKAKNDSHYGNGRNYVEIHGGIGTSAVTFHPYM